MSYLDPSEAFDTFKDRTLEAIGKQFPVDGRTQTLSLERLEVPDDKSSFDLRSQHKAKVSGETWGVPVYAHLVLKNKETGKETRTRTLVAELPKMTSRYSQIVKGQEYQVDNQWQLKPGAYVRRRSTGQIETQFQSASRKPPFDITFDDESKEFRMEYKKAKLPLYPLLQALGVDDSTLEKTWGKDILAANKHTRKGDSAVEQFYKTSKNGAVPASMTDAVKHLVDTLKQTELRPDATEITLGKPFDHVNGDALTRATGKMLKVQAGAPVDDRDSLVFKDLRSVGDFAYDKIMAEGPTIRSRILRKLNTDAKPSDLVRFDVFNKPLRSTFIKNAAAQVAKQVNPLEMLSTAQQTTVMGPGGIQSERQIVDEVKFINPSHMAFLDPLHTPEGSKTGITLRMPISVRKVGHEPQVPLYNTHTGSMEWVGPKTFLNSKIALPDQVTWSGGKPTPKTSSVSISGAGNDVGTAPFKDVDYVMRHPSQFFNITSNLIPFMGNTSGGRASMATRHMEQAISLLHREAPLVQSGTGGTAKGGTTFEEIVGTQASHQALHAGVVTALKPDAIVITDKDGKEHEHQIYSNYPLNDSKSVLDSNPIVKVGDHVKAGDTIADTNYSKNGVIALGTNLRVGYIPYKGYNFEDGIVISESAAQKLSSIHMHKHNVRIDDDTVLQKKRFIYQHPALYNREQLAKVADDGIAPVGTRVIPGDPLVLAMKKSAVQDRVGLSAIRKSLGEQYSDKSLTWEGEAPGVVVGTFKRDGEVIVHVKSVEPMQVGDKLCYDEATEALTDKGWVPVSSLTLKDSVCTLVDDEIVYQEPTDVHQYAHGGSMYRIKSQQVDLFVTSKHLMYVQPRGQDAFELKEAAGLLGKRVSYKKDGLWLGSSPENKVFPELEVTAGQSGKGARQLPAVAWPTALYMAVLGAYLANGSTTWDVSSGNYLIGVDKRRGQLNSFLAVLDKHSIKYAVVNSKTSLCDRVLIRGKQVAAHFKELGHALDKCIPNHIFSYAKEDLKTLLRWLVWGDGTKADNGRPVTYYTSSKRLADDVQRLALHVGYAGNVVIRHEAGWQTIKGKPCWCAQAYAVRIITTKLTPTVNHGHVKSQHVQEEYLLDGYNGPVYCVTVPGHVLYVRRNGVAVWSGNSGRHGNKGIVTRLVPDKDMPSTPDGQPLEVALNPSGVPGRMNIGQVLETAASKIAKKTGKPYIVQNFSGGNQLEKVQAELKANGISDVESLYDPTTKQQLGDALVGYQFMAKLHHQVDKKVSVRSGLNLPGAPTEKYDSNLQPSGGGHTGGQAMDPLGLYALLAHGAKANIREMQTWKSEGPDPQASVSKQWQSQHHDVWDAIQHGDPLPMPKPTFAFKKFTDMLTGAGINMEKKGHNFVLTPLTDGQINSLTGDRVLTKPAELLYAKVDPKTGDPKPKPGGLFDEKLTGGHGGKKWSRIELAEPVPNPIFEKSIRVVTGLSAVDYAAVVNGEMAVSKSGSVVALGHGKTGGAGIEELLKKVDVAKDLKAAKAELSSAPKSKVDMVLKKVKRLQALKDTGMTASEAYVLHGLPVLPPALRPVSVMPDGNFNFADINQLYSQFAQNNEQLKDPKLMHGLTDAGKADLRRNLYDGMKAIMGVGVPYGEAEHKGLLQQIHGAQPKTGFFQGTLISRKQDMSMRSTIVPEPSLSLDEVGLPKEHAMKLFAPFVVAQLKRSGMADTVADAQKMVAKSTPAAFRALNKVMEERPVLLKRDPSLHKYSVQAFKPKAVEGNAIKIHPLVTGGYNADFDGNCYTGDVEILLKLRCNGSDEATIALLESTYPMKFSHSSKIICRDSNGVVVSTTLGELPQLGAPMKDKNGASVYELPDGMEVWSYDHNRNSPVFSKVTHLTVEHGCPTTTVKTRRFSVTASRNESLCVYDHVTEQVVDTCPKDAIGKLSPVMRRVPSVGMHTDFETGWLIGAFVSDGWVNGGTVGYSKASDAHQGRFYDALSAVVGSPLHFSEYATVHGEDCSVPGFSRKRHYTGLPDSVLQLLHSCYRGDAVGRSSLRKSMPPAVFSFSQAGLLGVLSGLFDGDGSLSLNKSRNTVQPIAQHSTSSISLRDDVLVLAQLLGIRASYTTSMPKEGRVQKNPSYTMNFSINDLNCYLADLIVIEDKAWEALAAIGQGAGRTKDDLDIVPVPARVMTECASQRGVCAQDRSLQRSLATHKSMRSAGYYVTRAVALRMLGFLDAAGFDVGSWRAVVMADDVHWDVIEEVTNGGNETVYDLVVPDTKVFVVNGGLVVWDTMSIFVPVSQDAVHEARKMFPSNNLFEEASGRVMYQPTLESALGLYKLSRTTDKKPHAMAHPADAIKAVKDGKISVNDPVKIGSMVTTTGRILVAAALPEPMQKKMLEDFSFTLDKKGLNQALTQVAREHTGDYGTVADKLKDIGNGASSGVVTVEHSQFVGSNRLDPKMQIHVPVGVHTLSLKDFTPDIATREGVLKGARAEALAVSNKNLTSKESDRELVKVWTAADQKMKKSHEDNNKTKGDPNNLLTMHLSGVKPGWGQYKQMVLAPMLVEDAGGRVIPTPITHSYAEGLNMGEYWTQMHGARRGAVLKVQQVSDPGYLSKLLMANTMDTLVTGADCGTTRGISLPITDRDVHDRFLQREFNVKGVVVPAGTMLTPTLVSKMRAVDKNAKVLVRSPLKCEHAKGLCQKCVGLSADGHMHDLGDNVGVASAQALGERSVQLTLRVFHTGGTVDTSGGSKVLGGFDRFNQLMTLPKVIDNSATLAMHTGEIEKVEKDPTGVVITVGGKKHHVGRDNNGAPLWQANPGVVSSWVPPKVGLHVDRGQMLSDPARTLVNPHDLYKATGSIESVQNYLADEVYGLYKDEGIKRQHVETVVKAMSNLTKIDEPGDYEGVLRGEFHPTSVISEVNRGLVKQGKQPIKHTPVLKGVDMMPLSVQEDWMAKLQHQRLSETILDAASTQGVSHLHGSHPVPGMAYGAEFGLTRKNMVGKPAHQHLHDVEDWKY